MRSGTIAFLLGILLFMQFHTMPQPFMVLLLSPVCLLLFSPSWLLRLLACLVCGILWSCLRADAILQKELVTFIEGQDIEVQGQVIGLPEINEQRTRFIFKVVTARDATGKDWPSPGLVRLNWYRATAILQPGQAWQLTVRLKRPNGFMNPGGFDYERWLFLKRIRATGYVVNHRNNQYSGQSRGQWLNQVRFKLRQQVSQLMTGRMHTDLVIALGLGDRSQLPDEKMTRLINTGTSHLLAISGLHIGLVATIIYLLVRILWSRLGSLPLYCTSLHAATTAALCMAVIYALLAGFTIPTQRALIMISVVFISLLSPRRFPLSIIISSALLFILILDPFAVLDAGFWLSFCAVAVIAYGMACRYGRTSVFWRWGRVQVLVAIGLVPVLLAWFQQFSLVSVPANFLAVPWVSFIIVPLVLAGTLLTAITPDIASLFFELADLALALLWPLLEILSDNDSAVWQQSAPPLWIMITSILGVLMLLMPAGMPGRWVGLYWLLPLFFLSQQRPARGEFWFTLLDVGQGLASVIHTEHHTLVFDTGAHFSQNFNAGSAVVVPFLRQAGTGVIDKLIISHGDNDHIGGATAVLNAFSPAYVLTSVPEKFSGVNSIACRKGQSWVWDSVHFRVLHPGSSRAASQNNQSCVLQVQTPHRTLLLTGDIEKSAEQQLLRNFGNQLRADVLVVPHHGSKTSSTTAFIEAVRPELALIAAGYRNRFKLPNQDIIDRYRRFGSKVLVTDRLGAISIHFDQTTVQFESYRNTARRFWHMY